MNKIILAFIVFLYIFTRVIKLMEIPIFIDEAMYLFLGNGIKNGTFSIWEAVIHGNPPFFSWYLAAILQISNLDPLLVGRLFSVILGLVVILLLYLIGKEHFRERVGIYSVILYTILPLPLVYDRLVLIEPLIQFFGLLLLYLLLKHKQKIITLVFSGVTFGLSLITKSSSYLYLLLILIFLTKDKTFYKNLLIILSISVIIWLLIRLNSDYQNIVSFNLTFTASISDLYNNPFMYFYPNLVQAAHWFFYYFGYGLLVINIYACYYFLKLKKYSYLAFFTWVSLVVTAEIFIAKIFYPRYFFFITGFLAVSTSLILDEIIKRSKSFFLVSLLLFFVLAQPIINSLDILLNINNSSLPEIERWQLLEGWPSGYGVRETVNIINNYISEEKTEVIVERYGLIYYSLNIYLAKNSNLIITNALPSAKVDGNIDNYIASNAKNKLIVTNYLQNLPSEWNVEKIASFPKIQNKNYIVIYKVKI